MSTGLPAFAPPQRPANMKPGIYKRHLESATSLVTKMIQWFRTGDVNSWQELEVKLGNFKIPETVKRSEWSYIQLRLFGQWFIETLPERIIGNQDELRKVTLNHNGETFGKFTLLPEQQGTLDAIEDAFNDPEDPINTALNIARTGAGKTVIGAAAVCKWIQNVFPTIHHRSAPVIIVTKKSIKITWRRHIIGVGLGDYLDTKILVTTYAELTSSLYRRFMFERYENEGEEDEKLVIEANPLSAPAICILDESQCVNRPTSKRAKFVFAWSQLGTVRFIYMSATPFVTINDTRNFCIAAGVKWNGMQITPANFNQFAGSLADDPAKPNDEAMKRFKKIAGKHIFITPNVKWPHSSFNSCRLCDFEDNASFIRYDTAEKRYLDFCRNAGKNTDFGAFHRLVMLMQYCQAVEPERIPQIIRWVTESLERKRYSLIFTRTRDAVMKAVMGLCKIGIPRSKISVIWGGANEIKADLILTPEQIEDISDRLIKGERISRKERRSLQMTAIANADKAKYQDVNAEEQAKRYEYMKSLGLYSPQSEEARQVEVDRFTEGDTWVLVGTIASGGTGLSLDHSSWASRPRDSYITPVYSAHEFLQAFGRGLRRTTKSDIYQYACLMKGTIEEHHVAPLLDAKLSSLRTLTSFDTIDMMEEIAISYAKQERKKVRTLDEVIEMARKADENEETAGSPIEIIGSDTFDEDDDDTDDND